MFGAGKKTTYGAVFDVRKDSISIAFVASKSDNDRPEVVFTVRKQITQGNGEDAMLKNTMTACKNALTDATQTGFRALAGYDANAVLTRTLMVVGAPWSATIPRNVQFEEDKPFTITAALLKDLEATTEERDESDLRAQVAGAALGYELVDRALVDAKVNGYEVEDLVGTTGSVLDLTEVSSFVHTTLLRALSTLIAEALPKAHLTVATHAFATYFLLNQARPNVRSFCFVSALPEMTEIGVVVKDALLHIVQVPYGTDTLLRSICEGSNLPQEHIRSQLCLRQDDILDEAAHAAVSSHFKNYTEALYTGLKNIAGKCPLPRSVYVLTDVSFKNLLTERTLETCTRASGQTHAALDTSMLLLTGDADSSLSLLSRFFHLLKTAERL